MVNKVIDHEGLLFFDLKGGPCYAPSLLMLLLALITLTDKPEDRTQNDLLTPLEGL